MSKIRYILCGILVVLCSCGVMFSGCGNSLDNLSVKLTSDSLVASEQSGEYDLTLVKENDDNDASWSATVSAEVLGLGAGMLTQIEWSWNNRYVDITSNSDGSVATIKGVTSTSVPTTVTAYSVENRQAKAVINVTNIVKPKSISGSKYGKGELGIPLGQAFSIRPDEIFTFSPEDATVPEYNYNISNVIVSSNEDFVLSGLSDGYVTLTASPKDTTNLTDEQLANLSYSLEGVRLYTPLTEQNTSLTIASEVGDIGEITLIKNASSGENKVVLKVSAPSSIGYSVTSPDNIVYNEATNPKGALSVTYDTMTKQFTLVGLEAMDNFCQVDFNFTVAGIKNSLVLTKSIKVRIVDYPTAIAVNGVAGDTDVSLRVFDQYAPGEDGTEFRLNIAPDSQLFTDITLTLDNESTPNMTLASKLLIDKQPFNGSMKIKSGTTMYLTNNKGYGQIVLKAYADATYGKADEVVRKIIINLEQSVTSMEISNSLIDESTKSIVLEIDEYNDNVTTSYRDITVNVEPSNASFDTISIASSDTNVFEAKVTDYSAGKILITANNIGTATLSLVAQSGVKLTRQVLVVSRYKTMTVNLDPNMSSTMYGKGLTTTKTITVANGITAESLERAYIAKTGSGNGVYLTNTFYPNSAVESGMIESVEFVSNNIYSANMYNLTSSIYRNVLTTEQKGTVVFGIKVTYYRLEGSNLVQKVDEISNSFTIQVFQQIESISLNESSIELLATVQSMGIGSLIGGTTTTGSVYDDASTKKSLKLTVSPSTSDISSASAKWSIDGNTSKIVLSKTEGDTNEVSSRALAGNDLKVSATIIVSITDLNGVTFVQEVKVVATKIQQITDLYINNYQSSLKNNSLYFELYKKNTFTLDVTVGPASATNKNLEYIIFDAEKLDGFATGEDIVRMASSNGTFTYYKILPRNDSSIYKTQYDSKTATLEYNEDDGTYTIVPKSAGYAFVFIVPQDVATNLISEVRTLTSQLRNVTDKSTIKRLPITVADGEKVYYQLYTPEDVASISTTKDGLKKNYYVMNTIDMSPYINAQLNANPNWTWTPIGDVVNTFEGSIQSMVNDDESPTQNIVGWTLSRNLTKIEAGSTVDYRNYGIFGVVTGEIKNVNFYFNNYDIKQTLFDGNDYNYGLVVGKITSREIAKDDGTTEKVFGSLSSVNVYCSNLSFEYKRQSTAYKNTSSNANIGAIGLLDAGCSADAVSVSINNVSLKSNDLIINFGGIIGQNKGNLGTTSTVNAYVNSSEVYANAEVEYLTSKTTQSALGSAIGLNNGVLQNIRATGQLSMNNMVVVVGGVVGINSYFNNFGEEQTESAKITNVLSSVKIRSNTDNTNAIQGGVVGYSTGGELTYAYYDIYNTASQDSATGDSVGIIATGFTGGIAGQIKNTAITYAIVQAYDLAENTYNLISNGGCMGGLVGYATSGSIDKSFVLAGLRAKAGVVAGILGQGANSSPATEISNVYARGYLTTSSNDVKKFAYVGNTFNSVKITDAYVDLNNDELSTSNGTLDASDVYVVRSADIVATTENNITTISRTEFKEKYPTELLFDTSVWAKDSGTSPINEGFPYLKNTDGTAFVRQVPNEIIVKAKTFDNMLVDGKINSILNVSDDTKKLIIAYQENKTLKLSDLFTLDTDLNLPAENVSISYTVKGTNVIQLLTTVDFTSTQIKIIGVGTAVIRINSSQNLRAFDTVQICVIDAFDSVALLDKDGNNIIEEHASGDFARLKIKHKNSTQIVAEYYQNGETVSGVMGGVKFITGLKYNSQTGAIESFKDSENNLITNYNISTNSWLTGKYGELDCLYYYVSNNDKLVFGAVGDDKDNALVTIIVPYFNIQFYELNDEGQTGTLNSYRYDLTGLNELSFDTQIYYGVSGIMMGVGDGTTITASEKLESSVTITNDAYVSTMKLSDLVWYELYEIDDDGGANCIAYYDPTMATESEQSKTSNDIYVNFTTLNYYESSNAVVINYNVELSQTMRKSLKSNKSYRIVIGAIDDNGEKISETVSLQWTFTPQEVKSVEISHYSDAINNGSKLTQAGSTPTNTIVSGEYGLLRITLTPDYANFDAVEVTSSLVNGQALSMDQRVLEVSTDSGTGEEVFTYVSWQRGVENITNGISLCRASLPNGDFNGNLYIRTICVSTIETGAQFTVTVTIVANGERKSFSRTLTVYKTDILSIAGEDYYLVQNERRYIVASGTGLTLGSENVWEQNKNPLTVSIGSAYTDAEISVDSASANLGASVQKLNNKYYLYTGSVTKGNQITVTLTAKQNIGGYTYRATRAITYEVVDFYVKTLRNDLVMPTTKRYAFIDGKSYDFKLFDGIDGTNLNEISVITFNPNDLDTCSKVLKFINTINGIGETESYNGWLRRVVEADGRISFVNLESKDEIGENWIDNNYQFIRSATSGYKMVSSGISSGNILQFELLFYYDGGEFNLTTNPSNAVFDLTTDYINLEFYQVTSQEHPQPIKTLNQFMSMQADIDYILLDDLEINDAWTPLNVAVKSFNGNGYTINFNASKITPSSTDSTNYGLFGTIDSASVIKNVKIVISENGLAVNNDEASLTTLNFGVLAGTNNGSIYNCAVYGLNNRIASSVIVANPTSTSASHKVAGLVGVNAGGISNSRVEYVSISAGGNVAGLVVENSGVIAGSYYSGGTITNRSESSNFASSGFVITNLSGGIITSSYTGGTYTTSDSDGVISLDTRESVAKTRDVTIQSGVTSAGFVYANSGSISDCYSAVEIFSTNMSGFVFTNYGSGKISRCYSTSDLSSTGSIVASYPFIGVNGDNATANNNYNKTDGIVNCYYYDSGFAMDRLEEAKELTADDFCGVNGTSPFSDFIFSRDSEEADGSEFTGVWVFADKDNMYFTPDRFVSNLQVKADSSIETLYTNFGPKLVSASLIATPKMELYKSEENSSGEIVHTYTIKYSSVFKLEENEDYGTDYSYDPIVVSNMEQFNNAFDINSDSIEKSGNIILSDIRIINHLTQSDLSSGVNLTSPSVEYAGILSGNGFTFNNVSLAVNNDNVEYYGLIGKLGVKSKGSDETVAHIGTIKNYNVTVDNIACSTVNYVGGLVGWVNSGNLYDIKVTNKSGRVVGNNIVGGIAGYVTGTSRVHTAYANVGVTANYRANTENLYNLDLVKAYDFDTDRNVKITTLGYAGGLFGVVDITQYDANNPSSSDVNEARVYNISADSTAIIVGKVVGGLIGATGEYTVVYKANKTVEAGALLKGYVFAGGIVGQNNGFIKYANITYTTEVQKVVDSANTGASTSAYMGLFSASLSPLAVGGIVGLNIGSTNINWPGGTVQLCSSKIAVRDVTAKNVGGVVGAAYGGDIRACLSTGSILASKTAYVGGIVGYLSDFSSDSEILSGMNNPFGEAMTVGTTIDYVVAMNNYLVEDYNYYESLHTKLYGAIGGIVGYVSNSELIYTIHTVANDSSDEYAYLTNPTNYFVSQITNQVNNSVTPLTSGKIITLYEEDDNGKIITNHAVGYYGTDGSINLGMGKTRAYMLKNSSEIFAGWDTYSIDNSSGTPNIIEKDLPDEIEVDSIEDLKIMYWHPEKDFVLTADIDFRDTTYTEGKRILSPFYVIGSESSPFTGSFTSKKKDTGEFYSIKNVYIINSGASSVGFFGAISNAVIKDIIIENIHYSTALNNNTNSNVGGLAGVATNSVVENVTITYDDSDIEYTGIFTNANNVGGMFGKIASINDGEMIIKDCYVKNNLVLTDNFYVSTGAYEVTLGGFAGTIEGNTKISNAMATGLMTVKYTDMTSDGASDIRHIVGGFAGQITGSVQESACVTSVNITLENVLSHTTAGGFVGKIGSTTLSRVDSHAKINVNFGGITDAKVMYIGGLVGESSGSDNTISGFVSAGDIILSGNYGINNLDVAVQNHYVAGIVANMGNSTNVSGGYSLTSIINNTILTNIDMGFGTGNISNVNKNGSVKADSFYALTSSDRAGVIANSDDVRQGGDLDPSVDASAKIFYRPQNNQDQYYRIKATAIQNTLFNTTYEEMYTLGNGLYKTSPILISQNDANTARFADINGENYLYYLQTSDISLTSKNKLYGSQITSFKGVYNGAGHNITLSAHFDINSANMVATQNCGLFGEVVSTLSEPSMLVGMVIKNVVVYANLDETVNNFGILAGKVQDYTILANCFVKGELNLNINGATNIGGLVGSSGANYIGCATELVANIYGTGAYNYGAIFGIANSQNNAEYTFIEVSSSGKVNNYGTNAKVAGMVADSSVSNLYARNSYTMTEINSVGTKYACVVYEMGGNQYNKSGILYDSDNAISTSEDWGTYSYSNVRNKVFVGGNYQVSADQNYGMPIQQWIKVNNSATYTGTGSNIENPYIINTAVQFVWMLNKATYGTCYALNSDLNYDLIKSNSGYGTKDFAGYLDGQYNIISNLSGVLFDKISGKVCRLGLNTASSYSGNILANSVTASDGASEIYAKSSLGKVIGSGNITNSLSNGADFGTNATNCYSLGSITDEIYSTLDHDIWIFDGTNYALKGFVKDCSTSVKPYGSTLSIGAVGYDGKATITVSSDQEFYNAMFYASNYSGEFKIETSGYSTLDLNGYSLTVPKSVKEISGITTIKNGTFANSSLAKFSADTLNIKNCGIIGDNANAILGSNSSDFDKITIANCSIVVNSARTGGILFDTIDNAIEIEFTDSVVFVESGDSDVDLIATNTASDVSDYEITISNVKIYESDKLRSVVNNNNASGTITASSISGASFDYIISTNSADITLNLNNIEIKKNIIASNSGSVKLNASEINNDGAMFGENTKKVEIELSNTQTLDKPIAETNGNGGEIIITGSNTTIKSQVVTTNASGGKITINLANSTISSQLVETNAGDLSVTLTGNSTISSQIAKTNSGTTTLNVTSGTITSTSEMIEENSGTLNVSLDGVTLNATLVGENTGIINWTKLSNSTIAGYLVETQNSTSEMTITLDTSNTISHALIKTADSPIKFVLNGTTINTQLVETNNSTLTIEVTNGAVSNLVGTNSSDATIEFTASGSTINQIMTNNSGKFNATITGGTVTQLIGTNNVTGEITAAISGGTVANVVGINNGSLDITINGNANVTGNVIKTNKTATITINNANVSSSLIDQNNTSATINIGENVTINSGVGSLVSKNYGTATINVNSALTMQNMTNFAFVGESNGTIELNINAQTTISGTTVSGVVSNYKNTASEDTTISVTLNANYLLSGTTATAIAGNVNDEKCNFDAQKNLKYTQNVYNIIVNSANFDPNPTTPSDPESQPTG